MQEKGAETSRTMSWTTASDADHCREEFRAATVPHLSSLLQAQGYTVTRVSEEIEKEKIVVQAMRQSKVNEDFVVSATQIQSFYNKNKASYAIPEQIRASHDRPARRRCRGRSGYREQIPDGRRDSPEACGRR